VNATRTMLVHRHRAQRASKTAGKATRTDRSILHQTGIISVIDGLLLKHEAQRWSQPRKRAADKSGG